MSNSAKKQLQSDIQDLKDALDSEFTPAQFKDDIRKQIKESEAELEKLEKAEREVRSAAPAKKPEKAEKRESAAQRVKKRVEQTKKTIKTAKKKQDEVKQEKKSALERIRERKQKRAAAKKPVKKSAKRSVSSTNERDASRKALKAGRRVSAEGNVYYENRSNRSDVQRRKYPYLEDGGFTNDGAGMFAGGGEIRMYNFLKDDLQKLENAIKENDREEINKFFSYWTGSGGHLKSLKTEENERMWNFMLDDLKELEEDIKEGDEEDIDKFFSYWNTHLETLKYAKGGIFGSDRNLARDRMFKSQEDWEQNYKRKSKPKNPTYKTYASGGEMHKTEYADGGVIMDLTDGLLADPRFDINSPMFARGGKLSNKYNYLPKYKIATITTDDGVVIDGNDIIDGLYVKKKVKF